MSDLFAGVIGAIPIVTWGSREQIFTPVFSKKVVCATVHRSKTYVFWESRKGEDSAQTTNLSSTYGGNTTVRYSKGQCKPPHLARKRMRDHERRDARSSAKIRAATFFSTISPSPVAQDGVRLLLPLHFGAHPSQIFENGVPINFGPPAQSRRKVASFTW